MSKLKSYMQINLSFQNVLGRGGMIGEICGGGGETPPIAKSFCTVKQFKYLKKRVQVHRKKIMPAETV